MTLPSGRPNALEQMFILGGAAKRRLKSRALNRRHARYAADILAGLEPERGSLEAAIVRLCNEYAQDVLGGRQYAPWLQVYSLMAGGFHEGWIPTNFYLERVAQHVSGVYRPLSDFRLLASALFEAGEEIDDVAAVANGLFVDRDRTVISDPDLPGVIFAKCDRVVFKTNVSWGGMGVHVLTPEIFDPGIIRKLGDGVFQPFIQQHEAFDEFSPGALTTIRLVTATSDQGRATVRGATLRLGRRGEAHIRGDSEVMVPIEIDTGMLDESGYMPDWTRTLVHPDTQAAFKSKLVPNFRGCVEAVTRWHETIPFMRCIGWDLAVDRDGKVKMLEWNSFPDTRFTQCINGPCFRDLHWERFRVPDCRAARRRLGDKRRAPV